MLRQAYNPARLRKQYRREIDEQKDRQVRKALLIFREALLTTGCTPAEIDRQARELEERMRGRKAS